METTEPNFPKAWGATSVHPPLPQDPGTPDPIKGWDNPPPGPPPWATGPEPDLHLYTELELFVAGALSTMEPFSKYHPAWALPFARRALEATGDWEPTDG